MTGPLNSTGDYAAVLAALRPRGVVWPSDGNSVQEQVLAVLAPTAERLDAAAQGLLVDSFPATAVNLLPDWESSLGLTESDQGLSTAARQAKVVAALTVVGGQSKQDIINAAAALGVTIAIQTYAPSRCGITRCGSPVQGYAWASAWSYTVLANASGMNVTQILAAIQALAPAETVVFHT